METELADVIVVERLGLDYDVIQEVLIDPSTGIVQMHEYKVPRCPTGQ